MVEWLRFGGVLGFAGLMSGVKEVSIRGPSSPLEARCLGLSHLRLRALPRPLHYIFHSALSLVVVGEVMAP